VAVLAVSAKPLSPQVSLKVRENTGNLRSMALADRSVALFCSERREFPAAKSGKSRMKAGQTLSVNSVDLAIFQR
jgi:hypothetical protein